MRTVASVGATTAMSLRMLPQRRAFADHVSNVLIGPDFVAQPGADAVLDGIQQGFIVDRFRQEVCGACFDCPDSHGNVAVAREKDDGDLRATI